VAGFIGPEVSRTVEQLERACLVSGADVAMVRGLYSLSRPEVQIVISDGLNANAVNEQLRALWARPLVHDGGLRHPSQGKAPRVAAGEIASTVRRMIAQRRSGVALQ
jgi:ethanolamine ammonia-lyase small subunit